MSHSSSSPLLVPSATHETTVLSHGMSEVPLRTHGRSPTTALLPTLLVVDDDPMVLEMLHDALDLWGFDVFLANDGREGLKILDNHKVDGILLDLDMPEMDGLTMLDELRWLGFRMPVVMMSGARKGPSRSQLLKEGAQGFMRKPFTLSFLRDVCKTIFGP